MDTLVSSVVAGADIYGVAAITTHLVEEARQVHGASPVATAALGRLLTGGLLMGSFLKETSHRITLQITSKGPVRRLMVEADGACRVRGYIGHPTVDLPSRQGKLDVGGAVGKGILHVIKDIGFREPASGTVPLLSGEIAEDLASYFVQSEQIPSAVALGVFVSPDYTVTAAGGFLIQFHATIADDLLAHIEQALAATPPVTTMIREGYGAHEMLQQALQGLELQVTKQLTPVWQCRCSVERVARTLIAIGAKELQQLIAEQETTEVRCDFCNQAYLFSRQELARLLQEALS